MNRLLLCAATLLFLTGITTGAGIEIGEIVSINSASKEIIVNVKSGTDLKMGELLEIQTGSGKIIIDVTFPMLTTSKCKIKGKGELSDLIKGMRVYRYSKDTDIKEEKVGKAVETKTIGNIEMVKLPGGTFQMGSDELDNEKPVHKVTLDAFWIGKYEVTQKQYREVMGKNPSYHRGSANLPVEQVSWVDAVEFCKAFSEKYNVKARLPSEAEWEYACRAGTSTKYYWGDDENGDFYWYGENSDGITHPVGQKKPNAFGLYDISGNVMEWCTDWFDGNYYEKSPSKSPKGAPSGSYRVLRGGSFGNVGEYLRSSARYWYDPNRGGSGFRIVVAR